MAGTTHTGEVLSFLQKAGRSVAGIFMRLQAQVLVGDGSGRPMVELLSQFVSLGWSAVNRFNLVYLEIVVGQSSRSANSKSLIPQLTHYPLIPVNPLIAIAVHGPSVECFTNGKSGCITQWTITRARCPRIHYSTNLTGLCPAYRFAASAWRGIGVSSVRRDLAMHELISCRITGFSRHTATRCGAPPCFSERGSSKHADQIATGNDES